MAVALIAAVGGDAARSQTAPAVAAVPPDVRPPTDAESARMNALTASALVVRPSGDLSGEAEARELLALDEATFGPEHLTTSYACDLLAFVVGTYQHRYGDAEPIRRRCLAIKQARLGERDPETTGAVEQLSYNLLDQKRYADAVPMLRRALASREAQAGPDSLEVAQVTGVLGGALGQLGQYAEASTLNRRTATIREARLRPDDPDIAVAYNLLGNSLGDEQRYPDAEAAYRKALALYRAIRPPGHNDIAITLSYVGGSLSLQGRAREGEPLLREALAMMVALHGDGDPDTLFTLSHLAACLNAQARYREAEVLIRRALAVRESLPDSLTTAGALASLAGNLEGQSRFQEAEPLNRRVLAIRESQLGARAPSTAVTLTQLGTDAARLGRSREAEALYRRVLAIRETIHGPDEPAVAYALGNVSLVLFSQGRFAEAELIQRRVVSILEARMGSDHPDTSQALTVLAWTLSQQGRYAEAEPLFRRSVTGLEASLGPNLPGVAFALLGLADNTVRLGNLKDAETQQRHALSILETAFGRGNDATANVLSALGQNLTLQGRIAEAEALSRRALAARDSGSQVDMVGGNLAGYLALNLLQLGRPADSLGLSRRALREDLSAMGRQTDRAGQSASWQTMLASSDHAVILLRAAWLTAAQRPAESRALLAESFAAAQSTATSASAEALAQGAARVAAERAGAGAAVAAWRGAQARIWGIDGQIGEAARQGAAGDARRSALTAERAAALEQVAGAERDLSARFPRYFDLLKSPPVTVADLQATAGDSARLLRADEALVLLFPGGGGRDMPEGQRKGLAFVVTKQTSAWAEIPLDRRALDGEVAALHAMLADPGAGATVAPGKAAPRVLYNRTRAFALYRALFGAPEIQAALAGKRRWLIAPQGSLMSLPFAALPTQTPPGGVAADADPEALRATQWLGMERTLAILPSVSALRVQRLYPLERVQSARTPFFGLGDPAFSGVADGDVRSGGGQLGAARSYFRGAVADPSTFSRLPRLENTAREIRQLATNLGGGRDSYVLQLNASEAELRRRNADGRLARAEIVAFATHGLVAGEFQNSIAEPALALTPPVLAAGAQLTSDNDGLLTASEAATLTLSARFVILSACNTASGGKPDADSLSGLARAFFYAGAQSLLVSHYPVYDAAAMRLTTEAARLARTQNMRNPEAMRASMRALQQDASADATGRSFSHPTAWAPFAVIDAN